MSEKLIIEDVTIESEVTERDANAELVGRYPYEVTLGFGGRTATFISYRFIGWSSDIEFVKDTLWGYTSDFYILEEPYDEVVKNPMNEATLTEEDYEGIVYNKSAFDHLFGGKASDVEDEVYELMH